METTGSTNMSDYAEDIGQSASEVSYEEVLTTAAAAMALSNKAREKADHHHDERDGGIGIALDNGGGGKRGGGGGGSGENSDNVGIKDTNVRGIRGGNGNANGNHHRNAPNQNTMNVNATNMNMTQEEAELLSSLPQRPIANFPSESDRKRVIGCLATVISMMYEYEHESCDTMIYKPDIVDVGIERDVDSHSNHGRDELSEIDGGDDDFGNVDELYRNVHADDLIQDDSFEAILETSPKNHHQQHPQRQADETSSSKTNQNSFNHTNQVTVTTSEADSGTSSEKRSGVGTNNTVEESARPSSSTTISSSSSSSNNVQGNNNYNINTTPSKQTPEMKIIIQRYKKRRHKVYSKFLVSAADYLFLDKSNAIAFLPLLNSLMDDDDVHNSNNEYGHIGIGIEAGPAFKNIQNTQANRNETNELLRDWNSTTTTTTTHNTSSSTRASTHTSSYPGVACASNTFTPPRAPVTSQAPQTPLSPSTSISQSHTPINPPPQKEPQMWDDNDILVPFVESLEAGAGFQCLSLLLLNYLLQSEEGYDARIRACIKKLGVVILIHEIKQSECEEVQKKLDWYRQREQRQNQAYTSASKGTGSGSGLGSGSGSGSGLGSFVGGSKGKTVNDVLAEMATRKFESLEHTIAAKLLRISESQQQRQQHGGEGGHAAVNNNNAMGKSRRDRILHGLKIGSAGVAAGALFAVTGGLAAPGIAAGLAATGLTTGAVTAGVVTTLTSTAAVTTIFGVGGGSLAAYKTHRRTKGVTEFEFIKEGGKFQSGSGQNKDHQNENENAELFSTVCISGWLKDTRDFQRPWGVEPTNPPIVDRVERLARFYAIHKPENIPRCQEILKRWKGEERELWSVLKEKYGSSPDTLYPIYDSPYRRVVITHEEDEIVDNLLGELGYTVPPLKEEGPFRGESKVRSLEKKQVYGRNVDSMTSYSNETTTLNSSYSSVTNESEQGRQEPNGAKSKKPIVTVWDYQMEYGGELLTIKWESDLLMELCDSVQDLAADLVGTAARELLKQTALSALITAVALPYGLVRAANMIDGTWTLAIERADLAGIELARTLLESQAGHRPVVLIGYSMGARTVYSCLKELSRQQEIWEEQQEELALKRAAKKRGRHQYRVRKNKRKDEEKLLREPASIVEDAILMGLPNHLSLHSLESCRRIVAGRLVNCYSQKDLILSLMFQFHRLSGALRPVCGTSPVRVRGVENYDVSSLISSHSDYCTMTAHILRMIYHGCPHRSQATIIVPSDFATDPAL